MDIFNSDIVTADYDVFWEEIATIIGNKKPAPVLVISEPLPPGSQDQLILTKMLQACGLSEGQRNVVEIGTDTKVAWHKLKSGLQPKVVLLVNIAPTQLGISALLKLCDVNRFDDVLWIPFPSISILEQQQEWKKQLWLSGMKPVFVDKIYGDILAANME